MQNYRISLGFFAALLVCVCMGTIPIVSALAEEAQSADQAVPATEEVTLSVTGMT